MSTEGMKIEEVQTLFAEDLGIDWSVEDAPGAEELSRSYLLLVRSLVLLLINGDLDENKLTQAVAIARGLP